MTAVVLQGVGGILGSMLGGPIGGSIGALAGSLIGNLLDPPKIQGPRLGDTKLQRSTYGTMIPYAWGHGRIGTIVIDQTDLEEHKHTSGGKGGPEITNYTYSASWAAALCARLPNRDAAIAGITHIFADARLIWSQDSGDECPCTVYLGTEDQEPDPTFEGIHGVGNVPGYRGIAYVVFTDFDLTDYGNRIPQIEIVIYTKGGEIPWRVSEFAAWETPQLGNYAHSSGTYSNGVITTVEMGNGGDDDFIIRKWDVQGNQIGTTVSQPCPLPGTGSVFGVLNANIFMRSYRDGGDDEHEVWFYYNESTGQIETGFDNVEASLFPRHVGAPMIAVGDFIFAFGHDAFDWYMGKFQKNGGAGGPLITEVHLYTAVSGWSGAPKFGTSNIDGELYVLHESSDGIHLWKYNTEDMTILEYWPPSSTAGSYLAQSEYIFHVHNGIVCNGHDPSSSFYNIRLTQLGEGSPPTAEPYGGFIFSSTPSPGSSIYLGAGLLLDPAGVYSIIPPAESELLSDVCLDITSLTPTTATVDASELEEDEVRWYVLGQEMTARNALEKLRPPYFFDVVEEDYGINFRKRGDREVVEIDEDDLVPFDGTGDLLRTIRKREQELPRTVTMTYIDVDSDWQTGAQSSPRQVTQSQYDVTLEIPVGFTAIEAAQKCWTIQCAEWNEREAFQFQTTRRWAKVTPTTLVKVRGRIIRVQTVTESPDGKIAYEGVLAAPSIYTQTSTGAPSSGSGTQNPPASKIGTELVLLDIPVISQADAPFGFYAAMGPASDGSWPGATLFKSLDGGVTYEAVASSSSASVIGVTADLATSPPYSGELSAYGGGDVVEEAEIAVILTDDDAELTSCTATALANGANLCAISRGMSGGSPDVLQWEVLQFRDATLIDTDPVTYVIGGFLRGRKGTSTADHAVGDRFVLLPVTNVDAPEQELNVSLKYKAVTYGRAITTATAVDFVNTGVGSEWYYGTESGHLPVYVNEQTGTTYTVDTTDRFRLIAFNNASPVAVTLPDGMPDGWNCFIENVGAGDVTLTPASWVIDDGASDLTLATDQGILLASDGAQWWTMRGMGSAGGGTYTPSEAVNAQTGTTYTVQSTDRAKLVTLSNTSAVAVTLPQATGSFAAGWYCDVKNLGAGAVTITPTTSTIGGSATLVLTTGRSARIVSDGTNYLTAFLPPGPGVNAQTGTTYTYVSGDRGKLVTHSNGSSIAGTLPQATGAFGAGWFMWVQNRGAGTLTITPTTSTIDGASSITLATGKGALIVSNGTDYYTQRDASVGGTPTYQLEILIGDGVNPILTGTYPTGAVVCPRAGTITGWQLLSCDAATPTAGAIVIDLWRDSYANYPPTVGDSIIPSGTKPTIGATNSKATSSSLTGWTTSFSAGDVIFPNVDSVTSLKAVKLILTYN